MAKNLGQFRASSPYLRMPVHSHSMSPQNHAQVHPCNSTWVISNTSPWDFRSGAAWKPFNPVGELLTAKRWTGLPPDAKLLMERCTMRELLGSLTTSLFSWKSLQKIASILKYWSHSSKKWKIDACQARQYAYNIFLFYTNLFAW